MEDILTALAGGIRGFSKSQRSIAGYILSSYDKAAFMTAGKLASETGVSESTVVRFAQELGYRSYPEMRRALQDVARNRMTSLERIQVARELLESGDILSHVFSSDVEQIRETMEDLSRADFDNAVTAITNARNIYIFGLRSSSALANFMGFYFNLLFENVRVVSESSALEVFEQILRIKKDDVFIALSFPRYSNRTIRAVSYARECGATVIGITDNASSPIAKFSDCALYAKSDMVSFVDTLTAPLSLVNALIVAVSAKSGADIYANFERLERVWDEYGVYEKRDD
ncbi:MAG: MurR/RpiR family transcriptional regulator [Oscillospiraceae bacterium]|jgi:DNA-binding MurR/RpiR family transcriptional regulator|nr:MurR/RpiR family transcriptional regulator [Oscillospiraceae bacterium]